MVLQTEVEFTLPKGYLDADGNLHKAGVMRLATAADEILPLKDPRVQQNPAYLTIIVLSRVILRLGSLSEIDPRIIEGLFAADLSFLQRLYERLNGDEVADSPSAELPPGDGMPGRGNGADRRFGVVGES